MKKTLTALITIALGFAVQAADVGVYLDSTDGSSALVVYDAQTNTLMTVNSDGPVETATNLTVNGTVTAASFSGDGSQLTGITTGESDPLWTNALQTGFSGNAITFAPQDGDDQNTLLIGNDAAEGFGGRLGLFEGGVDWHYITYSGGWLFDGSSFLTAETDPVWAAEKSAYATGTPLYTFTEADPVWESEKAAYATGTPLYTFTEADPVWESEKAAYATGTPLYTFTEADPVWESEKAAYATGTPLYTFTEADPVWESEKAGYSTGTPLYVEADPVFGASTAADITSVLTGQWTEAHGWGDHADGGYADNDDLVAASNALRSAVTTETSSRIGADASLSNAVSAETSARIGADASLSNASSTVATDLNTASNALRSAITTETSARVGADASLSNAVSAETSARIGADAALSNEISSVDSDLAGEAAARIGADASLSNEVGTVASDLADETSARIGADASLSNVSSTVATDLNTASNALRSAITTETSARIGADAALSNAVSAETSARIGADASLSNAVGTAAADLVTASNALQAAIGTESSARIGADAALSNAVGTVATDLNTASNALQSAIGTEAADRIGADAALSNAIGTVATDLNTASNALQADISTRLDSNTWAVADSTTNYMPRNASLAAKVDNIIVVSTNGTAGGAGSFDSPVDTPQNGYNAAASQYPSTPATVLITAGSYPGLVAGAPNIHVTGISRPQLASLRITNTTASILGKRHFEGLVVTGHVSIAGTGIKLDNLRINNGFSMTGTQVEVQNSFVTTANAKPAFVVGALSQHIAIYNSAMDSTQAVTTLVVGDNVSYFEMVGSQVINKAGSLAIDDQQTSQPIPLHFYAHNYIKSEGTASAAMQIQVMPFPMPPGVSVAFHNNTVWGNLTSTMGGVGAQFSNNAIYGTNSWVQFVTATADSYNNTHFTRTGAGTLPDSWED